MNILMVSDDPETAICILQLLRKEHHAIEIATDGNAGLGLAARHAWHLLIVDRVLPGLDGFQLVRRLRGIGAEMPALFVLPVDHRNDRLSEFPSPIIDYVTKPFPLTELLGRIGALTVQPRLHPPSTILYVGDLAIDLLARTVRRGGEAIELHPREFALLEYLALHSGQVVTRNMLLKAVWDRAVKPPSNTVESHISRLRAKIDRGRAALIQPVRGVGYRLEHASPG